MDAAEWIAGSHGWLKSDFEHHGMGKNELNFVDPAYDLAAAVLDLGLSTNEEKARGRPTGQRQPHPRAFSAWVARRIVPRLAHSDDRLNRADSQVDRVPAQPGGRMEASGDGWSSFSRVGRPSDWCGQRRRVGRRGVAERFGVSQSVAITLVGRFERAGARPTVKKAGYSAQS
jgi:hypothetical protein